MICRANVETSNGWALFLLERHDGTWRAEVADPKDHLALGETRASAEAALAVVRTYFDENRLHHVGVALIESARAELKFSSQPDTTTTTNPETHP